MGPDPTRAYFWPTVNKRPTRLWPGYFPTRPEAIFWPEGKKIEKFDVFRGNFPNSNPNHKWLTRPDPGQKILTRKNHYEILIIIWCSIDSGRDGPWPNQTWAYFWPVVNKRLARLWPRYFLTQPEENLLAWPGVWAHVLRSYVTY